MSAAREGSSVALGLVGRPLIQRVREHMHEAARGEVSRHLADDEQRAFGKAVMARSEGREWLVSRPGEPGLERMDEDRFRSYRDEVARAGGTLVTVQFQGSRISDMQATMTHYVGGILDGAFEQAPGVVKATATGIEKAYFENGRRLQAPRAEPVAEEISRQRM